MTEIQELDNTNEIQELDTDNVIYPVQKMDNNNYEVQKIDSDNNYEVVKSGGRKSSYSLIEKITHVVQLAQVAVYVVGTIIVLLIMMTYIRKMWDGSKKILTGISTLGTKSANFVVELTNTLADGIDTTVQHTAKELEEVGLDIVDGATSIGNNIADLGTTIGTGVVDIGNSLGQLGTATAGAAGQIMTAFTGMIPEINF